MVNTTQTEQTVSLVDRNGQVVASATTPIADLEPVPFPGTAAAQLSTGPYGIGAVCCDVTLPAVSTTNSRVYFVSGQDNLRYLGVDDSTGHAAQLPNVRGRSQAVFAVSPDDKRIAISVFDWSQHPIAVTIYVEDLGGGNRVDIFSSTSVYEWPVAWHAGLLVLAVLGGGGNPYNALFYHVANSTTGTREATLGSTACPVAGPLVVAGTACNSLCEGGDLTNPPPGTHICVNAVDWSGTLRTLYRSQDSTGIFTWAALSPDGESVVVSVGGPPADTYVIQANGSQRTLPVGNPPAVWWVDADTVALYEASANGQNAALYQLSTGQLTPVAESLGFIVGLQPGLG